MTGFVSRHRLWRAEGVTCRSMCSEPKAAYPARPSGPEYALQGLVTLVNAHLLMNLRVAGCPQLFRRERQAAGGIADSRPVRGPIELHLRNACRPGAAWESVCI